MTNTEYTVVENFCDCHPETCCCDGWLIQNSNGEKINSFYSKGKADKHVKLLNLIPTGKILYDGCGYYCKKCEAICEMYEQGLSCRCGSPWETEVIYEEDYPRKWLKVKLTAHEIK